ncbi:MAG TPA: tetratricopeptide repeat protein [Patescibacteria group bacterium]|nr:tetratricopeptide repeat protein [Patescibacteria group bacterium]
MQKSNPLASYFENMSLFVIGLFLIAAPLLFLTITTDAFVLPKQIGLALATILFFIFFVLKTITEGKLTFRSSPFDIPLILFLIVLFLSAIFSTNRFDALIAFVPYLFIAFFYFGIINIVKGKRQLFFILTSLVLGGVLASIVGIFTFFGIYVFPLEATRVQGFTTFGSLLDQALYFALVLPIAGQFVYSRFVAHRKSKRAALSSPFEGGVEPAHLPKQNLGTLIFFGISFLILLAAFGVTLYLLFTTQRPIILPLATGLQTAFAAISQDTGNIFKSLFLGSGIGTYLTDFTRFKTAAYNVNDTLWAFTFFRSSSFVLELIATTGLLGLASFGFLIFRIFREKAFFLPLLLAILASFLLPFSFTLVFLFFVLLAIFAVDRIASSNKERISEIELYFVAFKKRFFGGNGETHVAGADSQQKHGRFLSIFVSIILLAIIGIPAYFTTRYFLSDLIFQRALVAASQNQGLETYDREVEAIQMFPYRDVYYRAFSQTNLALASLLVQQNQGGQLSEEVQQNILTLIQQSINGGRSATTVAPLTAFNWNNLSSIYRALIGFGENADQFTLATSQQAIALDPNNPQQYIEFGGIYYQLGNYDVAIRQFQYAITLKNNYANAYYNLGHALEMKGNNEQAIQAYTIVRQLVANDPTNVAKIDEEIAALQAKTGQQAGQQGANQQPTGQQQPISVNEPTTQLPERDPEAEIPAPTISPAIPTPTRIPSVTPAP